MENTQCSHTLFKNVCGRLLPYSYSMEQNQQIHSKHAQYHHDTISDLLFKHCFNRDNGAALGP